MRRKLLVLVVALATAVATAAPTTAQTEEGAGDSGSSVPVERGEFDSYIVVMRTDPLVVTEGQDNLRSSRASSRGQEMRESHARVMREAGVPPQKKTVDYVYALDGFAAHVTYEEALELASHKDVAMVLPDELYQPMTDASPDFLGLTDRRGAWESGYTGEGVVVGIIDTGVWPEHPSFTDTGFPEPPIDPLEDVVVPGPAGPYVIEACDFGNTDHNSEDAPFECNNKLVGARQVLPNYRQLIGADPDEFDSARDDNGHGTHTASTAAGNADVEAEILGNDLGTISGIAPDAHVIVYKGLGNLGGFGSDLAAAIDQAVLDGVDVINYSIGGGGSAISIDEIAFLFAADAGVHVASSAGNSGPGAATLGNPSKVPWLTTVGASTQERFLEGTVELGDGREFRGASVTQGADSAPLVDGADHGSDICNPGPPAGIEGPVLEDVEGAIVLCRRGETARVAKSLAVAQAGGVGMIMYENSDEDNLFSDTHFLPTVHLDNTPGLEIKAYIEEEVEDATAEIRDTAVKTEWDPAPSMAAFSSRGPNVFDDILKPDITAPGFQILAGYSPVVDPGNVEGELFAAIAGTSMSSPHVAGLFALLDQANPDWSPAAARSALMTTAHQDVVDNDRVSPADPFDMGAGHVDMGSPSRSGSAFDPGLVYEAGITDYFGFLCDVAPELLGAGTCESLADAGIPTEATDLNYPSITVSELPGVMTVTRTVTSVADQPGNRRYRAQVEAPEGYSVEVSPSAFNLRPGESQTYEVTITNQSAPLREWRFGSLTWRQGQYEVRSPISVRGAAMGAPDEVTVNGTEGWSSLDFTFGYDGPYTATGHGFAPDVGESGTVEQDPDQECGCEAAEPGEVPHTFAVADSAHMRITLDASDLGGADPSTDIDLYLYRNGEEVATSMAGGTDEVIELAFPEDGEYTLWVHGWSVPEGPVDYQFHRWDVPAATGGSLSIDSAPDTASSGTTGTIEFSWEGLDSGTTYLGGIVHDTHGEAPLRVTLVRADT